MAAPDEIEDKLQPSSPEVMARLAAEHRRFLGFLEKRLGDRAAAEDVLQSAFVLGIERGSSLRSDESAVAWFFRVLRNALVDHRRRAGAPASVAELAPDQEPLVADPETTTAICQCILGLADTLNPDYALALKRVELDGLSVQDFAREEGITANNASVRLFRAREALRKRVGATCRTCAEHGCLDCSCRSGEKPRL